MHRPHFALFLIVMILSQDITVLSRTFASSKKVQKALLSTEATQGAIQLPKETVSAAKEGLEAVSTLLETFKDSQASMKNLEKALAAFTKVGAAFGAIGAVFSVLSLFFPEKDRFGEILNRLDQLESRITNLINDKFASATIQNAKNLLNSAEDQINSAAEILNKMQKSQGSGQQFTYYKNQFLEMMGYNQGQKSYETIFQVFKSTYIQRSFPQIIIDETNGDQKALTEATKTLLGLLVTASVNYFAYLNIVRPNDVKFFGNDFNGKFAEVVTYVGTLAEVNYNTAVKWLQGTYEDTLKANCDAENSQKSNQKCAESLVSYYSSRYPDYLYFTAITYDPDEGYEYHFMVGPVSSYYYAKKTRNRNVAVFWEKKENQGCRPSTYPVNQLLAAITNNSKGSQKCQRMANSINTFQRFFVKKNSDYGFKSTYSQFTTVTSNSDYFAWAADVSNPNEC